MHCVVTAQSWSAQDLVCPKNGKSETGVILPAGRDTKGRSHDHRLRCGIRCLKQWLLWRIICATHSQVVLHLSCHNPLCVANISLYTMHGVQQCCRSTLHKQQPSLLCKLDSQLSTLMEVKLVWVWFTGICACHGAHTFVGTKIWIARPEC